MSDFQSPASREKFHGLSASQKERLHAVEFRFYTEASAPDEAKLAALAAVGDAEGLARAMGKDPLANPSLAASWAAENGHADCVAIALAAFEPGLFHPMAAMLAAENGHADCLALALPKNVAPSEEENWAHITEGVIRGGDLGLLAPLIVSAPRGHRFRQQIADAAHAGNREALLEFLAIDGREVSPIALLYAASGGHAACVRELLPSCDPTAMDSAALRGAAEQGSADCVRLLLDAGALLNGDPAPLWRAIEALSPECVGLLIASTNLGETPDGGTLIHFATGQMSSLNQIDSDEDEVAAEEGAVKRIVEMLALAGVDPGALDSEGASAQSIAEAAGRDGVARFLGVLAQRREVRLASKDGSPSAAKARL